VKRATRRALLIGAVAAIAATIAIQWLWTTDEERVVATLDALQEGFERRDVDRIEPWLLPDAQLLAVVPGVPRGKPLLEGLRVALGRFERLRISRNDPEITLRRGADATSEPGARGDAAVEATVVVTGTIFVEVRDVGGGPFAFSVTANFQKQPDGRFVLASVEQFRADPGIR
jgi:hypothetical protein